MKKVDSPPVTHKKLQEAAKPLPRQIEFDFGIDFSIPHELEIEPTTGSNNAKQALFKPN